MDAGSNSIQIKDYFRFNTNTPNSTSIESPKLFNFKSPLRLKKSNFKGQNGQGDGNQIEVNDEDDRNTTFTSDLLQNYIDEFVYEECTKDNFTSNKELFAELNKRQSYFQKFSYNELLSLSKAAISDMQEYERQLGKYEIFLKGAKIYVETNIKKHSEGDNRDFFLAENKKHFPKIKTSNTIHQLNQRIYSNRDVDTSLDNGMIDEEKSSLMSNLLQQIDVYMKTRDSTKNACVEVSVTSCMPKFQGKSTFKEFVKPKGVSSSQNCIVLKGLKNDDEINRYHRQSTVNQTNYDLMNTGENKAVAAQQQKDTQPSLNFNENLLFDNKDNKDYRRISYSVADINWNDKEKKQANVTQTNMVNNNAKDKRSDILNMLNMPKFNYTFYGMNSGSTNNPEISGLGGAKHVPDKIAHKRNTMFSDKINAHIQGSTIQRNSPDTANQNQVRNGNFEGRKSVSIKLEKRQGN